MGLSQIMRWVIVTPMNNIRSSIAQFLVITHVMLTLGSCASHTEQDDTRSQLAIAIDSTPGADLLVRSEGIDDYIMLSSNFTTQSNLAFCGVASSVITLNALGLEAPESASHGRYRIFTQENFFTDSVESSLPESKVRRSGMTLEQLGRALTDHGAEVRIFHSEDWDVDSFRREVRDSLSDPRTITLVNYHRSNVGQDGGGHISPVGAYDAVEDRFLVMDVSTYKYPFIWVRAENLFSATTGIDSESRRSRGWVIVGN